MISKEAMIEYGNRALQLLKDYPWTTFFDALLAVSLMHFNAEKVDYLLLETGIGGRYDSTNFCDQTEVCVITSISLDHQDILGNTIEEIAWQKAGIIKKSSQVFTSSLQPPSVLEVFRRQSEAVGAELNIIEPDRCVRMQNKARHQRGI